MLISPELRASQAFVIRRALLVPCCLCLIAAFHAYRVFACGQTAWKGGGFGMFSSVDAENARFVKVYLQTSSGEVPLEVPASFRKEVAVLKAAPNQASANHLALRLANEAWSDASGVWLQRAAAVKKSPTYGIIDAAILHLPPEPQRVVPAAFGSLSQWEPASKSTAAAAIEFQEVRVEVWRYRYERAAQCLQSELLFTSHEPRPEKQP